MAKLTTQLLLCISIRLRELCIFIRLRELCIFHIQEALLTALSDVVMTCSATLKSQDCPVKCEDIIKAGLREARKESLSYKV